MYTKDDCGYSTLTTAAKAIPPQEANKAIKGALFVQLTQICGAYEPRDRLNSSTRCRIQLTIHGRQSCNQNHEVHDARSAGNGRRFHRTDKRTLALPGLIPRHNRQHQDQGQTIKQN